MDARTIQHCLIEELCSQRARNGFDQSALHYHIVASSDGGHILGASHVSSNFNLWATTGYRLGRPCEPVLPESHTSFTLATRVGSLGSARIGALVFHCSHYSELARRYRLFVLVRYCITGYVVYRACTLLHERAVVAHSYQIAHAQHACSMVCIHTTHATRVDTGQPGCAKRAGPARFGMVQLALDSVHTRGNARQPGLRRQVAMKLWSHESSRTLVACKQQSYGSMQAAEPW